MKIKNKLIVALDVDSEAKAVAIAKELKDQAGLFKIGLELFTSCGPSVVKKIMDLGCGIFLDLKFHDIPNTVAKAAAVAARLDVSMFNVHALGGYGMMRDSAEIVKLEAERLGIDMPKILAVTILTSMDEKALKRIGISGNIQAQVLRLASLAREAGLDGVVASPQEAGMIRKELGEDFLIVTPGIRPGGAAKGDQRRVTTPKGAIKAGADYIVVGRPITEAEDPLEAARAILKEMNS